MEEMSGLAFIEVKDPTNPLSLFREWLQETEKYGSTNARVMNLATATRNGDVTSRTVVLRELMDDFGLTILAPSSGQKQKDIAENPKVACCFLWTYSIGKKRINRQIRIEGLVEKLPDAKAKYYYDQEPLFCQIRSHICRQGEKTEWNDLKSKHDEILKDVVENGKKLEMPNHLIAHKILPKKIDFYYAWNRNIGDRVTFCKTEETDGWIFSRIAA